MNKIEVKANELGYYRCNYNFKLAFAKPQDENNELFTLRTFGETIVEIENKMVEKESRITLYNIPFKDLVFFPHFQKS
jgi:hypothetical protein